jgi:hypothetical protein
MSRTLDLIAYRTQIQLFTTLYRHHPLARASVSRGLPKCGAKVTSRDTERTGNGLRLNDTIHMKTKNFK